jgi:fluoroacetyl-CoA thioesterase
MQMLSGHLSPLVPGLEGGPGAAITCRRRPDHRVRTLTKLARMSLAPGLRAEVLVMVEHEDTAIRVGSGDVPVLGTPRLLSFAEGTTVKAVQPYLEPGQTSVGTKIRLEHLRPSPVGMHVEVSAELIEVDGRRLVFSVMAVDKTGTVVATGTIERAVVDRERFLARL